MKVSNVGQLFQKASWFYAILIHAVARRGLAWRRSTQFYHVRFFIWIMGFRFVGFPLLTNILLALICVKKPVHDVRIVLWPDSRTPIRTSRQKE